MDFEQKVKLILENPLTKSKERLSRVKNVVNQLDELLDSDELDSDRLSDIKSQVYQLYLKIEDFIGQDA